MIGLTAWWPPLLVVLTCLCLQTVGNIEWLRYQRTLLSDGEFWRLLSAHFIHLNGSHWMLNMLGLGLIYQLFGHLYPAWQWLLIILISALGVSLGLLLLNPGLDWYVGFSGALHGLIIAGAVAATATYARGFGAVLLLCVTGKLVWEQWAGPLPGSAEAAGGNVIVDAHLYGAVAGLVYAILVLLIGWQWRKTD